MSYYLKNPGGRIVAVESETEYQRWLTTEGFTSATPQEIRVHIEKRHKVIQEKQKKNEEAENPSIYLSTVSPGGKDGYAVAAEKMTQYLRYLGVNIQTHQKKQKIGILFHNPYSILRMENQFRLMFTMFESTKLPDDWRDYLEAADHIIVPSKWCQGVFKEFGFEAEVVPLGYDDSIFTFHERPVPTKENGTFYFLHYNAFNIRKGFVELWEAFNRAFRKDEPVKLILKTTVKGQLPLPITPREYPNVIIEQGPFEEEDMIALLHKSHCFVYPSRGEGFGLTPLEAMATGLPAIIPNATGMSEYFNADCMYEVNVESWTPAVYKRYRNQDVGKMALCSVNDLAQKMRWVYDHQEEAKEKGRQASEWVKQWTWSNTAVKLKTIIDKYQAMSTENRPIRNILTLEEVI